MIDFITGDIFDQEVEGMGHGVNCKGVMGAGIAPLFAKRFPNMEREYIDICKRGTLQPGLVHIYLEDGKFIYNIASQNFPGSDARYPWLFLGLQAVRLHAEVNDVQGVALPRIGCGIGGLEWDRVSDYMNIVFAPSPVQFFGVTHPKDV